MNIDWSHNSLHEQLKDLANEVEVLEDDKEDIETENKKLLAEVDKLTEEITDLEYCKKCEAILDLKR